MDLYMNTEDNLMMNYDFPVIKTIDDVLPHIVGRDEFRVTDKDNYTVINYMVAFEETFKWDDNDPIGSSIRRECRGITFDNDGKLICRKYHKFFNVGEKEETQLNKINLYEPHIVLEKLDGSLISCQPTAEGFVLVTKAGVTDISQQAEVFIADKLNYSRFIKKCIQKGTTPIFEWCSRKNRIVIDYPEDQLILTAMRYVFEGSYVTYEVMKNYATAWGIPVVKAIAGDDTNITEVVDHIRKWDDGEGVVLRFDTGHMVKIKADQYVLRHKTKDQVSQEKNIIQIILNDDVDDLVSLLTPDDVSRIQQFQQVFWKGVDETTQELIEMYSSGKDIESQKDFAVSFVQSVASNYKPFMFNMRNGRPVKELLIEAISKSLKTVTTVDAARWMWGNYKYGEL
jgi:RNA ligase